MPSRPVAAHGPHDARRPSMHPIVWPRPRRSRSGAPIAPDGTTLDPDGLPSRPPRHRRDFGRANRLSIIGIGNSPPPPPNHTGNLNTPHLRTSTIKNRKLQRMSAITPKADSRNVCVRWRQSADVGCFWNKSRETAIDPELPVKQSEVHRLVSE